MSTTQPSASPTPLTRRTLSGGLAAIALHTLLHQPHSHATSQLSTLQTRTPRAKRVIWLFMRGGVSQMESFDPKPALNRHAGQSIDQTPYRDVLHPDRLKNVRVVVVNDANGQQRNTILPLQTGFKKYGQSGIEISDWFPHIGQCADRIAFIRSLWTTDNNHGAQIQFASGRHTLEPRSPTLGAWVNYALPAITTDLPPFINIGPRFFDTKDGHYLGPAYDAINLTIDPKKPFPFIQPETPITSAEQDSQFTLIQKLNQIAATHYPEDRDLLARVNSYQLAQRMQSALPEALDLSTEPNHIRELYGLNHSITEPFARQLITARRLAERGVRFIQIQHGDGAAGAWDSHSALQKNHSKLAAQVDQPIAALLRDLEQRGMLDDTLIVFGTEFGRTPGTQGSDGRDHHPYAFSVWLAGGGIKGGITHGATDELGFHPIEHPHYVTDLHATILHQLGINPHHLEIPGHKRLEKDFGTPIHQII